MRHTEFPSCLRFSFTRNKLKKSRKTQLLCVRMSLPRLERKPWRPFSIGFSSAGALSTSMDPPGEPVISTWKRTCQKIQNGSEFPELVAQISRNPQTPNSRLESFPCGDQFPVLQRGCTIVAQMVPNRDVLHRIRASHPAISC